MEDDAVNQRDKGGDAGDTASRRKDARRNKETLLEAAAAVFVTSGVDAPVRDIASRAASAWAPSTGTSPPART